MRALWVARYGLLATGTICAALFLLGIARLIDPGVALYGGAFAWIAVVLSALACLIVQIWVLFRASQNSK